MAISFISRPPVRPRLGILAVMISLIFSALPWPVAEYSTAHAIEPSALQYIGYTKINVTNLERSLDFYTNIMGLKIARVVESSRGSETLLTRSGEDFEDTLVLVFDKNRTEPLVLGNAFNNITFIVFDFEERVAKLEAAGYEMTTKRTMIPSPKPSAKTISVAFTKDPDGFVIELLQFNQ